MKHIYQTFSSDFRFIPYTIFVCLQSLKESIESKTESFFYDKIHNLAERNQKIIENQEKYFNDWIMVL